MSSQARPIDSRKAIEILRTVRPNASRASLTQWHKTGHITPVETIHSRRFRYDPDQIKSVALRMADLDGLNVELIAARLEGKV